MIFGNKFFLIAGVLSIVSLGGFFLYQKVEEETEDAYLKGQELLASQRSIDLNKLSEVSKVYCDGMPLASYFYSEVQKHGLPPQVIAIIPRESSGNPYATGCDPCGKDGTKSLRYVKSENWITAVRNMGRCRMVDVCSVGFGLMQITSHTVQDFVEQRRINVSPYAIYQSKINLFPARPSVINEEPVNSPYHVCTNIKVGLLILKDKYEACKGREGIRRIACAVCRYNGSPLYLKHVRETIESKGGISILTKLGFLKDDAVDILKDFVVKIGSFFGVGVDSCGLI